MKKIAFVLVPFLGVALAKSEKMMAQKSETSSSRQAGSSEELPNSRWPSSTLAVGAGAAISGTAFVVGKGKREKLRF
jgi:hypothetical protein